MNFLLGCDEAGYGPNLGPLVISATAWQLPDGADADCDLYKLLKAVVCRQAERATKRRARRMAIADSKQLYQSGGSCALLEEPVLVALLSLGHRPSSWRELWPIMMPSIAAEFDGELWHAGYDAVLPLHAIAAEIDATAERFQECQQESGVRLQAIASEVVYPPRFNDICNRLESKGLLLSTCTLRLVAEMISRLPPGNVTVMADKHGGRNRYAPLLQQAFDDHWTEVRRESQEESCYRIRMPQRTIDFYFRVGGEAALPTAWASLCSKYLRELAMNAFNAYWLARLPNLRPTAGYPLDARRFLLDISEAMQAEAIGQERIWRSR